MEFFRSTAIIAPLQRRPVSAQRLRIWCVPDVILAFTSLVDERRLLPHIIEQARRSSAKIILAHVTGADSQPASRRRSTAHRASGMPQAREALDRMARQLRWLGFTCEPVLLSGPPELEIPLLVRSCDVGRVLFGFEGNAEFTTGKGPSLYEQILRVVDVPICAIGKNAVQSDHAVIRNVTLAVSSESKCEVPLSFACRLAQELRAKLTLLHVAEQNSAREVSPTPQQVIARLPFTTWREAELFCPTEVAVRPGDPVGEILNQSALTEQDLIILCSPGDMRSREAWRNGVSYRTIAAARCPVIVSRCVSETAVAIGVPEASTSGKFLPHRETPNHSEEAMK